MENPNKELILMENTSIGEILGILTPIIVGYMYMTARLSSILYEIRRLRGFLEAEDSPNRPTHDGKN